MRASSLGDGVREWRGHAGERESEEEGGYERAVLWSLRRVEIFTPASR